MPIYNELNQTVSIATQSGQNSYGEPTYNAATNKKARLEQKFRLITSATGEKVGCDAKMWVMPDTDIDIKDKVTYESQDYEVIRVDKSRTGLGEHHHTEIYLIRL